MEVTVYRKELNVSSADFGSLKNPMLLGELIPPHQQTLARSEDLLRAKANGGFQPHTGWSVAGEGGDTVRDRPHTGGG